ncbi:hypothetical protein FACS1894199_02940 [Bacteroidia bacterium]|nr:hypothetical protein FACS1894199_02940 [Bacteroidia bacterium]
MAAVSLNLRLEQTVIERMKEYAELEHTSLSQMVENIFASIVKSREKNVELNISPIVKAMSIDGIQVPADFDYKQELAKGREEKYL